jgi:hypothetical protein
MRQNIDFYNHKSLVMGTITSMSARSLQYYVICRRWASDIEFFKIETVFLHRLLDDYFVRLCNPAHIDKLKHVGKNLLKLETEEYRADLLITEQLKNVELMTEDIIPENAEELTVNQVRLEYLMTNLILEYREVKKELFALVESAMHENKPKSFG